MLQSSQASAIEMATDKTTTATTKSSDTSLSRKRCDRKIYGNKYEHNAPEIRNWWLELFAVLEADASIINEEKKVGGPGPKDPSPADQKIEVLRKVFPADILQRILAILSVKDVKFKQDVKAYAPTEWDLLFSKHVEADKASSTQLPSAKSDIDEKERKDLIDEMMSVESKVSLRKALEKKEEFFKAKMYRQFFKRKESRAAVWRTLPPLTMEEMNLNQKADAIAKRIATKFCDWITTLGGDENSPINVQMVIGLFEIGFDAPVATSLKVQLKEMPSLPQKVADARGMPQLSKRAVLHREIKRDHKATKRKPRMMAFGWRLPTEMQIKPQKEISTKKWLSCDKVPEDLSTMAAVWEGITHLKSTRSFCEFLLSKPEIRPPKYLVDAKMMDKRMYIAQEPRSSTRDRTQSSDYSRRKLNI